MPRNKAHKNINSSNATNHVDTTLESSATTMSLAETTSAFLIAPPDPLNTFKDNSGLRRHIAAETDDERSVSMSRNDDQHEYGDQGNSDDDCAAMSSLSGVHEGSAAGAGDNYQRQDNDDDVSECGFPAETDSANSSPLKRSHRKRKGRKRRRSSSAVQQYAPYEPQVYITADDDQELAQIQQVATPEAELYNTFMGHLKCVNDITSTDELRLCSEEEGNKCLDALFIGLIEDEVLDEVFKDIRLQANAHCYWSLKRQINSVHSSDEVIICDLKQYFMDAKERIVARIRVTSSRTDSETKTKLKLLNANSARSVNKAIYRFAAMSVTVYEMLNDSVKNKSIDLDDALKNSKFAFKSTLTNAKKYQDLKLGAAHLMTVMEGSVFDKDKMTELKNILFEIQPRDSIEDLSVVLERKRKLREQKAEKKIREQIQEAVAASATATKQAVSVSVAPAVMPAGNTPSVATTVASVGRNGHTSHGPSPHTTPLRSDAWQLDEAEYIPPSEKQQAVITEMRKAPELLERIFSNTIGVSPNHLCKVMHERPRGVHQYTDNHYHTDLIQLVKVVLSHDEDDVDVDEVVTEVLTNDIVMDAFVFVALQAFETNESGDLKAYNNTIGDGFCGYRSWMQGHYREGLPNPESVGIEWLKSGDSSTTKDQIAEFIEDKLIPSVQKCGNQAKKDYMMAKLESTMWHIEHKPKEMLCEDFWADGEMITYLPFRFGLFVFCQSGHFYLVVTKPQRLPLKELHQKPIDGAI